MDIQAILEQKRQKLFELRQRRLIKTTDVDSDSIVKEFGGQRYDEEEAIEKSKTRKISIAVQVDAIEDDNAQGNLANIKGSKENDDFEEKEVTTYDKGVQATMWEEESNEEEGGTQSLELSQMDFSEDNNRNNEESKIELIVNERELNFTLQDSLKLVNKVIALEELTHGLLTDVSEKLELRPQAGEEKSLDRVNVFNRQKKVHSYGERSVIAVDIFSSTSNLVLVSYSPPKLKQSMDTSTSNADVISSPGLVIVYNVEGMKAFPEFYLCCNSQANIVRFDKHNSKRIFGGLQDGSIVVWDLLRKSGRNVPFVPALTTPTIIQLTSRLPYKDDVKYLPHLGCIIDLVQLVLDGNSCVLSISTDGIINLWSSNLLASPKIDSLSLKGQSKTSSVAASNEMVSVRCALWLNEKFKVTNGFVKESQSFRYSSHFENNILFGTDNGQVLTLNDEPEEQLSICFLEKSYPEVDDNLVTAAITRMDEIKINNVQHIIAIGVDWKITIWNLISRKLAFSIPINYLAVDMKADTGNSGEFIILGVEATNNCVNTILEIWNLKHKSMQPIFRDCICSSSGKDETYIYGTNLCIDDRFQNIVTGLLNGEVLIYSMDKDKLSLCLQETANSMENYFNNLIH